MPPLSPEQWVLCLQALQMEFPLGGDVRFGSGSRILVVTAVPVQNPYRVMLKEMKEERAPSLHVHKQDRAFVRKGALIFTLSLP